MLIAVTNKAEGPRGIRSVDGEVITLERGEAAVLDVAEYEVDEGSEWFDFRPVEEPADIEALAEEGGDGTPVEAKAQRDPLDHDGDGRKGGAVPVPAVDDEALRNTLSLLDPDTDTDWTAAGLPSIDAVSALLGERVSRKQIEAIAPGLTRATAPKPGA